MWYYQRDNKKIGPIKTDVLLRLHEKAVISSDSLVRESGTRRWIHYSQCSLVVPVESSSVIALFKATSIFRSSIFILAGALIFYGIFSLYYLLYANAIYSPDVEKITKYALEFNEYRLTIHSFTVAINIACIVFAFASRYWFYEVVKNVRKKEIYHMHKYSVFWAKNALIIPFANYIAPFTAVMYFFKVCRIATGSKFKFADFLLICNWWFFNLFGVTFAAYHSVTAKTLVSYNAVHSHLTMAIFLVVISLIALIFWLIIIHRINAMLIKFLKSRIRLS